MEYIVGIAVIAAIAFLLTRKSKEAVVETAPQQEETPEAKVEAVNAQPVAAAPVAKTAKKAPAKKVATKAPAKAKATAKKPAAKAKKPKA